MKRSFPKNELYSMWLLMLISKIKKVDFLAFYDEEKFVGCVYLIKSKKVAYLMYIVVNDKVQSQGYGTKMLQEIANKAKELGYNKVYLWTDQAPEFYKKIGYTYLQQVEKNEGGYGELFYKEVD